MTLNQSDYLLTIYQAKNPRLCGHEVETKKCQTTYFRIVIGSTVGTCFRLDI